jgi:hypothetical protein
MLIPFSKIKENILDKVFDIEITIKEFIYNKLFARDDYEDLIILLTVELNDLISQLNRIDDDELKVLLIDQYLSYLKRLVMNIHGLEEQLNIDRLETIDLIRKVTETDPAIVRDLCIKLINDKDELVKQYLIKNYVNRSKS